MLNETTNLDANHCPPLAVTFACIPVACMRSPGRNIERLPIQYWQEIRLEGARPGDKFCGVRLCDDSMSEEGFHEGDIAIVRTTFEQHEVTPGRLVAVMTPFGLLIRRIYQTLNNKVRLISSSPQHGDMLFDAQDVIIQGVVVRTGYD